MPRNYPAKILLYGEHTVLRGGRGLAVPYPGLSLKWWSQSKPDERLLAFVEYLKATVPQGLLKTDLLKNHLLAGWQLSGNIPTGYGLGSSGAVCAAIWDRFATDEGKALSTSLIPASNAKRLNSSVPSPPATTQTRASPAPSTNNGPQTRMLPSPPSWPETVKNCGNVPPASLISSSANSPTSSPVTFTNNGPAKAINSNSAALAAAA